jgi:peptidoglycan/LPS O-acetylase OafA/YrhL
LTTTPRMSVSVTATKNLSPVRTAEDRARTAASEIAVVKPDRGKRILELDGVRGLAIALVLVFHYSDGVIVTGSKTVFGSSALFYAFLPTRLMWSGVDLFFVLSGFLIGGILLDSRDSPRYFGTFYARRIHRIFPIYYLMIAFVTVGVLNWPQSPLFRGDMPLWTYPLYAQNLTGDYTQMANAVEVSWSLAVEEQFYLLFPLLVRFCSRRTTMYALGVCIVGAPLLRSLMVYGGLGYEEIYPLLPTRADTLALGVVAAMIVRSEVATRLIRRHSRALYGCLVALVLAFATMLKWTSCSYVCTAGYSLLGITFFLFIVLLLVTPLPRMREALSASWLRWLGAVSYCVYLVHEPIKIGLFLLLLPGAEPAISGLSSVFVTVAALVATLAVAHVSWRVIERPLIHRGHVRYQY